MLGRGDLQPPVSALQGAHSRAPATVSPSITFPLAAETPVPSQLWQGHPRASGGFGWDAQREEAMPKWEPSPPFFPFCS